MRSQDSEFLPEPCHLGERAVSRSSLACRLIKFCSELCARHETCVTYVQEFEEASLSDPWLLNSCYIPKSSKLPQLADACNRRDLISQAI